MSAVGDYRTFKGYEQEAAEKYQLESWSDQLAEKADAAIAGLEADCSRLFGELQRCRTSIAELEATIERLKVCGNCGNHDDAVYSRCAIDGHAVPYSAACKLDPSRWTRRATP